MPLYGNGDRVHAKELKFSTKENPQKQNVDLPFSVQLKIVSCFLMEVGMWGYIVMIDEREETMEFLKKCKITPSGKTFYVKEENILENSPHPKTPETTPPEIIFSNSPHPKKEKKPTSPHIKISISPYKINDQVKVYHFFFVNKNKDGKEEYNTPVFENPHQVKIEEIFLCNGEWEFHAAPCSPRLQEFLAEKAPDTFQRIIIKEQDIL